MPGDAGFRQTVEIRQKLQQFFGVFGIDCLNDLRLNVAVFFPHDNAAVLIGDLISCCLHRCMNQSIGEIHTVQNGGQNVPDGISAQAGSPFRTGDDVVDIYERNTAGILERYRDRLLSSSSKLS